jgi:hypothetical protein
METTVIISPQQQRVIALILIAFPFFSLMAIFIFFIDSQIDRHKQAAFFARKLAYERAIASRTRDWRENLFELRTSPQWQSLFVPQKKKDKGATVGLVLVAGGKIQQSSTHRMETAGAVEIDEHVVFSSTTQQLAEILYALRASHPLFVIRYFSVKSLLEKNEALGDTANILQIELIVAEFEHP